MNIENRNVPPAKESPLPLVRLALILPFVRQLDRIGVDTDAVLLRNGLVRSTVEDPEVYVPVILIHRFLEDSARASNNPYFGAQVGERLDLAAWPPFMDAAAHATTLGDFMVLFLTGASEDASSARHILTVEPDTSSIREKRMTVQEMAPAQNDAFTAAYLLKTLRLGAGARWDAAQIQVKVCDPEVLPPRYLGVSIIAGDRQGTSVRFPTPWLHNPVSPKQFLGATTRDERFAPVPADFLEGLRRVLLLNIGDRSLAETAASYCGLSRHALQRRLKSMNTTLGGELAQVRRERAQELLVDTEKSIVEIADALGFATATSFTRAFKSWIGQSPREYRKARRGGL
jgi:AraC-like DNA-binding protein